MATNKYIGSRYVPKYFGTWSSTTDYEALSIVSDAQGVYTYTSKRPVPAGTLLSNTAYWAQSGTLSESMQMGTVAHVDSTKADDATISANKLNITFASDYTMNDSTEKALNLDDTIQSGTYGINPSLCSNVPTDLSLSSDTCQLFVYVLGADKYTQTIVCHEQGKQFARMYDQLWSNWEMVGFTPKYASKANAGLVQLGDGLKAENATGLVSIDYDASLGMNSQNKLTITPATKTQLGGVVIGDGIDVDNGIISISGTSGEWVDVTSQLIYSGDNKVKCYVNNILKLCYFEAQSPAVTSNVIGFSSQSNFLSIRNMPATQDTTAEHTITTSVTNGSTAAICSVIFKYLTTTNFQTTLSGNGFELIRGEINKTRFKVSGIYPIK